MDPTECPRFTVRYKSFSGGPVVDNLPSSAGDMGSIPGQRSKISYAAQHGQPPLKKQTNKATYLSSLFSDI